MYPPRDKGLVADHSVCIAYFTTDVHLYSGLGKEAIHDLVQLQSNHSGFCASQRSSNALNTPPNESTQRSGKYYRPWRPTNEIVVVSTKKHIAELSESPELSQRAIYADVSFIVEASISVLTYE